MKVVKTLCVKIVNNLVRWYINITNIDKNIVIYKIKKFINSKVSKLL